MRKRGRKTERTILLKDLAPREDVTGGAGKAVFGQSAASLPFGPGKLLRTDKRLPRGH